MASITANPTRYDQLRASRRSVREALACRLELLKRPAPEGVHGPRLKLLLGELGTFALAVTRPFRRPVRLAPAATRRVVILLPGFGTHPLRMRYMARALERAGHKVKRWGLGFNLGPSEANFALLEERVRQVRERYGQDVVLVGWSLGGIFARELAKRNPDRVAKVITMGSPFSGTPYSNNAWRIYQLVTGHSVEQPPIEAQLAVKPPTETLALWSARDGVVSPRSACGWPGERDRARRLHCTHLGFASSEESIRVIAEELERD